jgi:hypothetical protein
MLAAGRGTRAPSLIVTSNEPFDGGGETFGDAIVGVAMRFSRR